ncbi:MAG: hypothetical protein ACR2IV_13170 [Bryobacteraceae bacterium]
MKTAPPTTSQPQPDQEGQYVRWNPHRSPYAIELKLELVSRLISEIAAAETRGIEVGGVLIGSFSDLPAATLRIEEFELVPRDADNGLAYMLDAGQRQYLAGVRVGATGRGRTAVGFFRSHLRPGPLRPSLADRSLLVGQFKDPQYVVLLIQAREPRMGAFFLALNGLLSTEPAVQEFRFEERALRSARRSRSSAASENYDFRSERKSLVARAGSRVRRYALIAVLVLIALGIGISSWPLLSGVVSSLDSLNLAVEGSNQVLKISWNHAIVGLGRATDASLAIADGTTRRVIRLGRDELEWGAVEYEPQTRNQQIHFTITVNLPGSRQLIQSADWQGNP